MAASTQALIDALAARLSLFLLPPTGPAYDQAPLGHKAAMICRRDNIPEEDMPHRRRFTFAAPPPGCDIAESSAAARAHMNQYNFVYTIEAEQGLIRSSGHDARTIAKAADREEDVGCVRDLQAFEHRMMTSIEETDRKDIRLEINVVKGQRTAYETELQERQSVKDLAVTQMMCIHTLEARVRIDIVEDISSSYIIMSDSKHSSVTYTSVPSPVEDYSHIGSPEVDGPPSLDYVPGPEEQEQAPLSLDYVPGPEEPEQAPPSPVYLPYVPEMVYPKHMPPEDDIFPAEEQPLPVAATPTADSPGYILEFDPKGDPKEDDEEDPKEDPADYPADSTVVALPAVDHVPSEESCLPLWKRLRFASPTPSQEVEESSAAVAARQDGPAVAKDDPYSLVREELYGFVDRDELVGAIEEITPTTLQGLNQRVTDLSIIVEQETTIMYGIMEDAQDDRSQLRGRFNLLYRDKPVHRRLAVMIEREARMAHEAWGLSMDASDNAHSDVMSLRTTLVVQHALILDLQKMAPKQTTRSTPVITTPAPETTTTILVTNAQLQAMIDQDVTATLAARDANRNGDDSHTSGMGRPIQWFEKMEYVYSISNCTVACQVKFSTCTLQGNALTWWNSHVKTTTPKAAHAMPWRTLKKMMTDKYCPRGKIKKLDFEMWNLKAKGTDMVAYSQRFQELALMCDQMFSEEIDKVERYVGGLPDTIHGSVMATKPKTMQDAIEFAIELMDKKINTWAECQADNKRKSNDTTRNNHQQPNKRQNTGRAYAVGNGDRRAYKEPRPLCTKCNYHHDGPCAPKCHKYNRFGHLSRDCRNLPNVNTEANQRGNICFECAAQGHFKKECPKLKNNKNQGNQVGNSKAQAKVYAVGKAGANPDNNVVTYLIPVELGSFDVIIGMDWLVKYHAVIICAKKIVRIRFGNEILIVRGDRSSNKHGTRLNIISYTKAQEYLTKGCHVFLTNIIATKDKDKSKEKRLKVLPVVQEFP
nr:hypothetical protein [Tanacetum cinerariifolium]